MLLDCLAFTSRYSQVSIMNYNFQAPIHFGGSQAVGIDVTTGRSGWRKGQKMGLNLSLPGFGSWLPRGEVGAWGMPGGLVWR